MQLDILQRYAARERMTVVKTFEIKGESAFSDNINARPEFLAAVEAAERREFDVLLVYDFSRFARSQSVAHSVLLRLRNAGVSLIGANGVDYTVEEDLAGMEAVFARRASRELSRRVRDAKAKRFSMGLGNGDVPFGYVSTGTMSPPAVVREEASHIRAAFLDRAAGTGYTEIARRWNSAELRPHSKRKNEEFTPSAVQSVLENDWYAGFVRHHDERRLGAHEPIITESEWLAAQAVVNRLREPRTKSPMLLSGLASCEHCDAPIWQVRTGPARHRVAYYRESRRGGCSSTKMWRVDLADGKLDWAMSSMTSDEGWLRDMEKRASDPQRTSPAEERARLQQQRERVMNVYMAEGISELEWRRRLREIDAALAALPLPSITGGIVAFNQFRDIAQVWRGMNLEEKHEAVRILFDRIYLDLPAQGMAVRPRAVFAPLFEDRRACCVLGTPGRNRTCAHGLGNHCSIR